jgi:hypothetical protein
LLWGWKDVVVMWFTPRRLQRTDQMADVNWVPLSVVMVAGTPYLDIQAAIRASAHVLASMLLRGTASSHLVDLSMMVRR